MEGEEEWREGGREGEATGDIFLHYLPRAFFLLLPSSSSPLSRRRQPSSPFSKTLFLPPSSKDGGSIKTKLSGRGKKPKGGATCARKKLKKKRFFPLCFGRSAFLYRAEKATTAFADMTAEEEPSQLLSTYSIPPEFLNSIAEGVNGAAAAAQMGCLSSPSSYFLAVVPPSSLFSNTATELIYEGGGGGGGGTPSCEHRPYLRYGRTRGKRTNTQAAAAAAAAAATSLYTVSYIATPPPTHASLSSPFSTRPFPSLLLR